MGKPLVNFMALQVVDTLAHMGTLELNNHKTQLYTHHKKANLSTVPASCKEQAPSCA